ncbi:ATP-dependent DNA helicase PIF1 [Hirsutella rhossiliensis]|uniref:ATP-dependent DNA helicase PIF1 n=1 Tax=Hirsutella rhossiliensis TaxID=111463 RepID=A0A9P8SEW0_9HYPO|nr:ATP-dependent DNA helicase PIF1 [Hirsutella rhossiliensis]KAH0958790.1 ATP-dependent DNA helicase PIF1 [Hirsutella rhossiliensis]
MDDEGSVEIEELFALLNQRQETGGEAEGHGPNEEGAGRDGVGASPDQNVRPINELRMLSVARKDFGKVERVARSMTAQRLAAARVELESSGKTTDEGVKELLRSLSLYGHRQPMSREVRLNMRRKIQSLIVGYGVPAIWFTINPNDITNPVKLRLAAYRTRDPGAAEEFLEGLGSAYKRTRLAMSDPMSAAVFFHREMKLFFDHYVKVGEESVFGRIGKYYGAVETNERGALHVHGLLWLHGNAHLSSMLADIHGEDQAAYRERIIRYVDSVFSEDLDQEGFCAVQAERSVTSDISSLLDNTEQFSAAFDEEANFCAGATQVHTHSPTCVNAWAYLNTSLLYWEVFRRWPYLRRASGAAAIDDTLDESVLRRPGKHATVCLDGYLSKDFGHNDDEESCHRRAAVQHLALFVPWESFLCEETGEINSIWERAREALAPRISCLVDNVQLLRRSAEDAKRDAKQWAASSGDGDSTVAHVEEGETGEAGAEFAATYRSNNIGDATRLIDVVRGAVGTNQVTAKSPELMAMMRQLCRFQQSALCSTAELEAIAIPEQGLRCISMPGRVFSGAALPPQDQVKAIKSQQITKDLDGVRLTKRAERFIHGQSRMDWQEKDVLVIDEISGIPIVLFCGDFQQFRPVQERSIVLPSAAISWDVDNSFKAEQRHQHDKAHALWKRFTTVVMLNEQMRAAGDPELQGLLKRIRQGVQDRTDLDLLNSRCYREGRRILWETGITVVTPLNRNRWNLNMEASLAFRVQQRSTMRIFISEHKWKEGLPTEEEAIMVLNQGDDSAIPVPAVFMFVAGMPVVVNHNTHQGLKLVNGAGYSAVEVIVDKASPGHRISSDMTIHFGRRRGYYWNRRRQRTSTSSGCRRARSC